MRTVHESKVPPANRRVPTHKKLGRCPRIIDLPTRENKEHAGACGLPSLPWAEFEAAVLEQLRGVLRAPGMVADMVTRAGCALHTPTGQQGEDKVLLISARSWY